MKLARVMGTVVSTFNVPQLDRRKLLVCELESADGSGSGRDLIAVDTVGAGVGERVLILDEGNSARQILGLPGAPIRAVVAAIVDRVDREPVAST